MENTLKASTIIRLRMLLTKRITSVDIPKNAEPHTIMVPTADTVRTAYCLQVLVAANYHTLFTGLTGTGHVASFCYRVHYI